MPRIDWNKLNDLRRQAADREFGRYDFKEYDACGTSGWEHASGSGVSEWTRPVSFVDPDDPDGPETLGHFTVVFAPETNEVMDVYASINGNDIGEWPGPSGFVPAPTPLLPDEVAGPESGPVPGDDLRWRRKEVALRELERYGEEDPTWFPVASGNWEWDHDINGFRGVVFFRNPENPDGDTVKGDFNVLFVGETAEVETAYAGVNGEDVWFRPSEGPKP